MDSINSIDHIGKRLLNATKRRDPAVLIVDDTPTNIGVLRSMLVPEGYKIFIATSGKLALKIASQVRPDLILLDVMMPDMDGFETCRKLKEREDTRDIPVIFVTAKTDTQDIVEGFHIGAVDYINKPVRMEEVCARVRTQLKIRCLFEEQREQAERLRAVVNNMSESMLIFDVNGIIQFTNPACNHFLGYADGQLIEHSIAELLDDPLGQEYLNHFNDESDPAQTKSALPHGPQEVSIKHQNGECLCMDMTITPMFLRQPLYIGMLHDIKMHKQSQDALLKLAHIDRLTNIANRRHFDGFLQKEWQRAQRNGTQLSLVLLDVDEFKLYNDKLGHQSGDACLQQVAQAIQRHAKRPSDIAARYGGEEFVLVFAETGIDTAKMLAETVRAHIEDLHLPHPQSSASSWVTVSIGVASLTPTHGLLIDALFAAADQALYRAKAGGRNRVEVANMAATKAGEKPGHEAAK